MSSPNRPVMLELTCVLLAAVVVLLSAFGTEESRVLLFAICVGLVVGGIAVSELMSRRPLAPNDWSAAWGKWAGAAFVAIAAAGILNWPMRVSYELSRAAMDEAAQRVVANAEFAEPRVVGRFTVALPRSAECETGLAACLAGDDIVASDGIAAGASARFAVPRFRLAD